MERLLTEVCKIQYGFPFDSANFSDTKGTPLIRIRDVTRGYSETFTTEEYKDEYLVQEGDLLIGMDGEFNIAKWGKIPALLNQRVCRLIPFETIDKGYLFYYMPTALKAIEAKTPYVTVKHLSAKELNKVRISFPPLDEQRKIAAVLDKVSDLIAKRRQQLDKLDLLVKSKFVEMFCFGDNWPERKIDDLCISARTGPFGSALHHDEFVDKGIFVLGIDNAVDNKFSYKKMRYITEEKYEQLKRYTVHSGDVIITIMGTVGRSAVIPEDIPTAINTKHLACLTLDKHLVDPQFLCCAFQIHPDIIQQLTGQATGAIMDGLNLTKIKDVHFHCPPRELQSKFVKLYYQVDNSKSTIQHSLDKLETLKKALMQEYFG